MWVSEEQKKAAKAVSFQTVLAALNVPFSKVSNGQLLYYSPFTDERSPSCWVEPKKNVINDYSSGFSGDIIKFAMHVRKQGFQDAVLWLISLDNSIVQFEKKKVYHKNSKLTLTDVKPLTSQALWHYVYSRGISQELAETYLKQIHYRFGECNYVSLGFQNNSGSYELRSPPKTPNDKGFKGCLGDKDIRTISHTKTNNLALFEGFFNFLSFLQLGLYTYETDLIILNSTTNFDKVPFNNYTTIRLYLDNDKAGIRTTKKVKELYPLKVIIDCASSYQPYNDLNEYLLSKI
jgi:hypothetical protein